MRTSSFKLQASSLCSCSNAAYTATCRDPSVRFAGSIDSTHDERGLITVHPLSTSLEGLHLPMYSRQRSNRMPSGQGTQICHHHRRRTDSTHGCVWAAD